MNIARVEYYFAEMLSILEMPLESEWKIDVVNSVWDNDPCLINQGKVSIPNNIWFLLIVSGITSTVAGIFAFLFLHQKNKNLKDKNKQLENEVCTNKEVLKRYATAKKENEKLLHSNKMTF